MPKSPTAWWPWRGIAIIAIALAAIAAYYFGGARARRQQISVTGGGIGLATRRTGSALRGPLTPAQIYRTVAPSVVLITNYDEHGHKRALGSGFLIDQNGDIATNYHVIRGAYEAQLRFAGGAESSVTGVVGYSPERDVAVLSTERAGRVRPLSIGDSSSLRIGDPLFAIGAPLGLEDTLSRGILSARRGAILQMTTPISPGSSGGPVLDRFGRVVGISSAYMPTGEDLNFAVPISWVKPYIGLSSRQTLAEVARENAAEQPISFAASVPAGRFKILPLRITEKMADPELDMSFASRGGADGLIDLRVVTGSRVVWDSGRVSSGQAQSTYPRPAPTS